MESDLYSLILKQRHLIIESEKTRLEIERVSKILDKELGEYQSTLLRVNFHYRAMKETDGLWPSKQS